MCITGESTIDTVLNTAEPGLESQRNGLLGLVLKALNSYLPVVFSTMGLTNGLDKTQTFLGRE